MIEQTVAPTPPLVDLDALLQLVQHEPLTVQQVLQQLPPPPSAAKRKWENAVKEALERMRREGRLFAYPSSRGMVRYWAHDERERAREAVRNLLHDRPRTRNQLEQQLPRTTGTGASKAWLISVVEQLREEGTVHLQPRAGSQRSDRFALYPPVLGDYFTKKAIAQLAAVCKKLVWSGVTADDLLRDLAALVLPSEKLDDSPETPAGKNAAEKEASPPGEGAERLLDLMQQVERDADRGATVSIPELRARADFVYPDTSSFDRAVLDLAASGKVDLHRHVTPAVLTETERRALVTDGEGNYFIGVAKRV